MVPHSVPKHSLAASILLLLLMALAFPSTASDCELSVGWEPWRPYQFEDAEGRLTGLDVQLLQAAASHIDCELNYQRLPWPRTLFEIRQAGLVTVAAGADKTDKRQHYAYFSDPYRRESIRLYLRADQKGDFVIKNLEDIAATGFRLGITTDYHYGNEFSALMQQDAFAAQVEPVLSDSQNHEKLMLGRIDGFLATPETTAAIVHGEDFRDELIKHPLSIKDDDIHLMFSKVAHSPKLVKQFNQALQALRESSEYDAIMEQYTDY